jgi:hypothetical protein
MRKAGHSIKDILAAMEDGEVLGKMGISQNDAEEIHNFCTQLLNGSFGPEIIWNGESYFLIEQAFYGERYNTDNYIAAAIKDPDPDNANYTINWEISNIEAWKEGDEDCCNWDNPNNIELS